MKLSTQQRVYVQLQAALDALHERHFTGCDDISDVIGDGVDEHEVNTAKIKGEELLETLLVTAG